MTESTQLQTTENNNTGVTKMEPPPPLSTSPAPSSGVDQHYHQQQQEQQQHLFQQHQQQHQQLLQQKQQQQNQQYALKWNDFQTSILSSFRHLRDEEDFVDVTLACNERSFTAHKVVLSACSPYFRKLLKANPCEHPIVILRDVQSEDVENLLSFMYNGEVNVSQEQLTDFLKTANLLQVRGLADVNGSGSIAPMKLNSSTINNNSSISCNNHQNNNNNNKNKSNLNNKQTFGGSDSNLSSFLSSSTAAAAIGAVGVASGVSAANSSSSLTPLSSTLTTTTTPATPLGNTPAVQELKASSSSSPANHHWDLSDPENNKTSHLTPPPQKRIKSADLFRAQHGISPERLLIDREFPIAGQHPLTRERHRSRETSRDRDRSLEMRDSLLSQALENSNGQQMHATNMDQKQHNDLASLHAQSAGEDSNSSDTEPSDRGDGQLLDGTMDSMNGSLDNQRSHSFPSAFLGLQGIPGLLPGPSGIHGSANDFVSRRSLEMRVRATDPRPCPKCGKIYRSAHTLRTHLEDKHTVCPGYRCVLCGTVAKSRNSLHSHMSRQHRGISTKDLPVLPMPSAFDPELASRLLAKAGVKISPAELRARASPTNGNGGGGSGGGNNNNSGGLNGSNSQRNGSKLDSHALGEDDEDDDDDPEDLTTGNGGGGGYGGGSNNSNNDLSRYHDNLLGGFGHASTTITRIRNEAAAAAAAAISQKNDLVGNHIPTTTNAGQSLLDTYLQFITENTFGMGMTQEHAAAAALHAAKMAQLNAIGHHGLDKMSSSLLAPQFDLAKIAAQNNNHNDVVTSRLVNNFTNSANNSGLTIEPILRRDNSNNISSMLENGPLTPTATSQQTTMIPSSTTTSASNNSTDIRRDSSEPMDLGLENHNQSASGHSECDDNYSEDEGVHNT